MVASVFVRIEAVEDDWTRVNGCWDVVSDATREAERKEYEQTAIGACVEQAIFCIKMAHGEGAVGAADWSAVY